MLLIQVMQKTITLITVSPLMFPAVIYHVIGWEAFVPLVVFLKVRRIALFQIYYKHPCVISHVKLKSLLSLAVHPPLIFPLL